jgi:hypothetical protein
MFRRFSIAVGLLAAACGCWLSARTNRFVDVRGETERLQGTWVVASVEAAEPGHVGALLTFEGNVARFQPKELQKVDLARLEARHNCGSV